MKYIFLIFLFVPQLSFALESGYWRHVCYSEDSRCGVLHVSPNKKQTIYLSDAEFNTTADIRAEYASLDIQVALLTPQIWNDAMASGVPTVTESYQLNSEVMVSPLASDTHSLIGEGATCVVGVGICSILPFTIPVTEGLSVLIMKAECSATGISCALFADTVSAWRARRKAEMEKEKATASRPHSIGGDPAPGSGGGVSLGHLGGTRIACTTLPGTRITVDGQTFTTMPERRCVPAN